MPGTENPILITGAARSGTSMVAGVIHLCGAWKGDTSGPNKNNQKGMFENHVIRQQIVKPHLMSIGADKMGQYPLPDVQNLSIPVDWHDKVVSEIKRQGYQDEKTWMYKGAKMCLTWPIWDYAFPNAKWIIVRRRTPDIINSCLRTGFMSAFAKKGNQASVSAKNEYDGWLWWVRQHELRFSEMITAGLNCKVVWPDRMVNHDYSQIKEAIEWLGLDWDGQKVLDFIEPKLWHARHKK